MPTSMFRATVTRSTAEPEEITAGAGTGYFALVWSSAAGLSRNIVGGAQVADRRHRRRAGPEASSPAPRSRRSPTRTMLVRVRYRDGGEDQSCARGTRSSPRKAFDAARLIRDLPADTRGALTRSRTARRS